MSHFYEKQFDQLTIIEYGIMKLDLKENKLRWLDPFTLKNLQNRLSLGPRTWTNLLQEENLKKQITYQVSFLQNAFDSTLKMKMRKY